MTCMRHAPILVLCAALVSCDDGPGRPDPAPAVPSAEGPQPGAARPAGPEERGRVVYETVCAACHALDTPTGTAPTLREIADRYRAAFDDPEEAIERLADYIREPDIARSLLPQDNLDEWGLMPPQPIPAGDLEAAATFIWTLPDSAHD